MWVDYRGPLSTVYNEGKITTSTSHIGWAYNEGYNGGGPFSNAHILLFQIVYLSYKHRVSDG